jgi:hypothetical protein
VPSLHWRHRCAATGTTGSSELVPKSLVDWTISEVARTSSGACRGSRPVAGGDAVGNRRKARHVWKCLGILEVPGIPEVMNAQGVVGWLLKAPVDGDLASRSLGQSAMPLPSQRCPNISRMPRHFRKCLGPPPRGAAFSQLEANGDALGNRPREDTLHLAVFPKQYQS